MASAAMPDAERSTMDDLVKHNALAAKLATARRTGVVCFVDHQGDKYFFKHHGIPHGASLDGASLHDTKQAAGRQLGGSQAPRGAHHRRHAADHRATTIASLTASRVGRPPPQAGWPPPPPRLVCAAGLCAAPSSRIRRSAPKRASPTNASSPPTSTCTPTGGAPIPLPTPCAYALMYSAPHASSRRRRHLPLAPPPPAPDRLQHGDCVSAARGRPRPPHRLPHRVWLPLSGACPSLHLPRRRAVLKRRQR